MRCPALPSNLAEENAVGFVPQRQLQLLSRAQCVPVACIFMGQRRIWRCPGQIQTRLFGAHVLGLRCLFSRLPLPEMCLAQPATFLVLSIPLVVLEALLHACSALT